MKCLVLLQKTSLLLPSDVGLGLGGDAAARRSKHDPPLHCSCLTGKAPNVAALFRIAGAEIFKLPSF